MFLAMAGTAGALVSLVYLFIALVDPWGGLPLSPALPRVPVTTSARFAFPMLARDARFDSAVIGSSTARLLRPDRLNPLFGARFVNLAFDAATTHEATRLLHVFLQSRPAPASSSSASTPPGAAGRPKPPMGSTGFRNGCTTPGAGAAMATS